MIYTTQLDDGRQSSTNFFVQLQLLFSSESEEVSSEQVNVRRFEESGQCRDSQS